MTSKEAMLSLLGFISFQVPLEKQKDWQEVLDAIKQDLERLENIEDILEILKRNAEIVSINNSEPIVISISKITSYSDWLKVKEWLENEKVKRAWANN